MTMPKEGELNKDLQKLISREDECLEEVLRSLWKVSRDCFASVINQAIKLALCLDEANRRVIVDQFQPLPLIINTLDMDLKLLNQKQQMKIYNKSTSNVVFEKTPRP